MEGEKNKVWKLFEKFYKFILVGLITGHINAFAAVIFIAVNRLDMGLFNIGVAIFFAIHYGTAEIAQCNKKYMVAIFYELYQFRKQEEYVGVLKKVDEALEKSESKTNENENTS